MNKMAAMAEATFAVVTWGGSFVATKVALNYVSPVTVVWLRFGMGVMILGAAMLARRQLRLPNARDLGYLSLLGFLGITFHQWLQSTALVTSQASTTAWIVATTPVFMALLGWLILKEQVSWYQVGGICLAALGVLLVVTHGDLVLAVTGSFGEPGDFLVLISAANWAVFSTLSRRGLSRFPATWMMFYVMGLGWLFTSVLFFTGPGLGDVSRLAWEGWAGVAFLGIFCSGLAYIFWYDALQALPVAQAGAFVYLEPFITVIVAAIVLGERLIWASLLGGAGILVGVWLVNRPSVSERQIEGAYNENLE